MHLDPVPAVSAAAAAAAAADDDDDQFDLHVDWIVADPSTMSPCVAGVQQIHLMVVEGMYPTLNVNLRQCFTYPLRKH